MKAIQVSQRKPEKRKLKKWTQREQREKYKMSESSNNKTIILSNKLKIVRVD